MKLRLVAISTSADSLIQLPESITSFDQVKPLAFDEGTLWVVLLERDK